MRPAHSPVTVSVDPDRFAYTASHLLYDGKGGWIEAKKVWMEMPWPEADGAESGEGWRFKSGYDAMRWLDA